MVGENGLRKNLVTTLLVELLKVIPVQAVI